MSRNLVVVRANAESLHPNFLDDPKTRNFDVLTSCYGSTPSDLFQGPGQERAPDDPDLASPALYRLITARWHDWALRYDYVWLCADDVLTDQATVNKIFELCREYKLDLAQPAFDKNSHVSHEITQAQPEFKLRYTTFVEGTCPCFSYAALLKCWPTYGVNKTGYGIDLLWPKLLGPNARIAVLDTVPVTHTRRRGVLYVQFDQQGLDPLKEMHELVEREDLEVEKKVLSAVVA